MANVKPVTIVHSTQDLWDMVGSLSACDRHATYLFDDRNGFEQMQSFPFGAKIIKQLAAFNVLQDKVQLCLRAPYIVKVHNIRVVQELWQGERDKDWISGYSETSH